MFSKNLIPYFLCITLLFSLVPAKSQASGLFKPAFTYSSGGAVGVRVAVADINADGKPDLVVANYYACSNCTGNGSVGVLLGSGNGTFQAPVIYDAGGSGTSGIAVGDVNGDGKLDVVITNCAPSGTLCDGSTPSSSLGILLGNGDGTLQPSRVFSVGSLALSLVLGDFNGDSKLDVAVAGGSDSVQSKLVVLLGNGEGAFQFAHSYDLPAEPFGLVAADVNGDGKLDLAVGSQKIVGSQENGPVSVLLGNGDGSFQVPLNVGTGMNPIFADLNGDARLDLLSVFECANPTCSKGALAVRLNDGGGTFGQVLTYSSGAALADFIAVGDLNRDHKLDVFVANYSGKVGVLLGNGDGTFSGAKLVNPGLASPQSIVVADVNGDGKPDLLVGAGSAGSGVGVLLNNTFWKTATTLSSSPNPSIQGQKVTLVATITTQGWIAPTGKVVFENGSHWLGSAPLVGGIATLSKTNLPVGTLSLTARYQGDLNSAKSTSPVVIQVVTAPAATTRGR